MLLCTGLGLLTMDKDKVKKIVNQGEISNDVLQNVIDLAKLDPLGPSMTLQSEHLKKILDHFSVLAQVDVSNLDPTIQVNPAKLPLREDITVDYLSQDEALANARLRTPEFFQVPKILEPEESEKR